MYGRMPIASSWKLKTTLGVYSHLATGRRVFKEAGI